eukprot:g48429.t1
MTDANGKEELKADSVVVTLGTKEVEEFGPAKPGKCFSEKLQVLKAKLQEAMKLRRVEERQKRQALYQLDNEQGFENEEDEEEELTESEEDDHETVEFLLGDEDAGVEADNDTQSTETAQNQDILTQKASTPTPKPIALEFSQALNADTAPSCKIRFSLEDETQSQLLDSDGFLNVGHRINKWQLSKRQLLLDSMDENAMDANMGELLGYCSGEFKSQNPDTPKEKSKEKEQNFDELLELCSGKFLSPALVSGSSVDSSNTAFQL